MRRAMIGGAIVLLLTVSAAAQEAPENAPQVLSHADFSALLLDAMSGAPQATEDPGQALATVKELGLVPSDWVADAPLTHGELADVAMRIGITYTPADRDSPVSPAFAEAFLRREASRLRSYRSGATHGLTTSHVLDQGVDRAVSPIDFP